jgi:hypothetical protein
MKGGLTNILKLLGASSESFLLGCGPDIGTAVTWDYTVWKAKAASPVFMAEI